MRALMRSMAPTEFEDVAALVALYRPGPMAANMHNDYADRKNGRQDPDPFHPDAQDILGGTYGLCIYQEELMQLAQKFAGYDLAQADNLRKAMGKKIREKIQAERAGFVDGCEEQGYGRELGEELFDTMEPFADYAFNKSHSYGYGFVSYQTAYLKANYPVEYLACLLTSVKSNLEKAGIYLNECRQLGINVLVPDVNRSEMDFTSIPDPDPEAPHNAIPFGLSAVRNVGEGLVELIIRERSENGPFESFIDFCERVDYQVLNKRTLESLIKARRLRLARSRPQGACSWPMRASSTRPWRPDANTTWGSRPCSERWTRGQEPTRRPLSTIGRRSRTRPSTSHNAWPSRRRCSASTSPTIR